MKLQLFLGVVALSTLTTAINLDQSEQQLAQSSAEFMLIYNLIEKFIDHFFPVEHEQMTKITPVKINCIEKNSSIVSRGGKHQSKKSGSNI
mmetsp:Transcript_17530/g.20720  ORF Transcript_17530/g.20720 Transcript_17530/m.20720 type:complete len:91 (+) Transcript_17530:13-285(+)